MLDYASRLRIPIEGSTMLLFTETGVLFSAGFRRVVIGGRGPYIEYERHEIICELQPVHPSSHYYYEEYRSVPDGIKVYDQKHKVKYADYEPGFLYVSPFDLLTDTGEQAIERLKKNPDQGSLF